jgi:hypothetical protein
MLKRKKIFSLLLSAVMVFSMATVFAVSAGAEGAENSAVVLRAAPTTGLYRILASALKIRQSASSNSTVLGQIPKGRIISVSSVVRNGSDYWGRVSYMGISGYINLAPSYVEHV